MIPEMYDPVESNWITRTTSPGYSISRGNNASHLDVYISMSDKRSKHKTF